jgi:hypothetical protein
LRAADCNEDHGIRKQRDERRAAAQYEEYDDQREERQRDTSFPLFEPFYLTSKRESQPFAST